MSYSEFEPCLQSVAGDRPDLYAHRVTVKHKVKMVKCFFKLLTILKYCLHFRPIISNTSSVSYKIFTLAFDLAIPVH